MMGENMTKYKLIASDLDGTLLKNNMSVSVQNKYAIKELIQLGVYFVPSSGRTLNEFPQEVLDNPHVRYIIHSIGAVVYDKQTKKRITMCMPHDLSMFVLDTLNEYDAMLNVRNEGNCYVDVECVKDEACDYYRVNAYFRRFIYETAIPVTDLIYFCRSMGEIEMISAFFHDDAQYEECKKRLEATGELIIACSGSQNMEIIHKKAGKGNALYCLAELLGIDKESTIGVGDSTNDSALIEAAGLGLAVGNACDELKEIADEVICSNEEHIMVHILENYIKNADYHA